MQAKNEVRKLFVNCCRVYPDRCLELIVAVLTSFPQPWSSGDCPSPLIPSYSPLLPPVVPRSARASSSDSVPLLW